MASTLKVQNIAHSGGTNAMTIDSAGRVSSSANAPIFSVYLNSNLNIPDATTTVIQYNTEIYDPSGWYNTSTYRWVPQQAGYYFLRASARWNTATDFDISDISIRLNGSAKHQFSWRNERYETGVASGVLYFNGSSDYSDVIIYQDNTVGTQAIRGQEGETTFQGFRIF